MSMFKRSEVYMNDVPNPAGLELILSAALWSSVVWSV